MKGIVFGLICCFVLFGASVQGQGMLVNLGMEAEPVIIQVYSNTPGVLDCGGEIKGFGFKDCKEILAAFSSNERWIMQVQGRKLLVGKLPIGSKMASGMFLIPAHLAGSFVKCKCQSLDIYSIQGLDCERGCKELNQDTSVRAANGAGTRSAIPSTRNKPGLRSDAPPTPEKEHAGSTGQQTGGVEIDTTIQAGGGAGTRSAIPSTRNKPGLRSDAPPTPGKEQSTSVQGQTSGLEKGITNQSNQNKPKAEVKTLGDLVSYRTEGNSPKETVVQKGGGAGTRSAIPSTRNKPGLRSDAPPTPEKEHAGSTGQQTGGVEIDTTIQAGGGAGTRSAIPSTRNKPGLRSETPPTPGKEQSTSAQGQTSGLEKGITNQSNQNKPKAEVKTLGDLVSYRTEGNSPKDTVVQKGGGAGTRSAIPSTRNKPGLRSDAPPTPEKEHARSTGQQTGGVEIDTTIQAGGGAGTRSAIPSTRNKPGLRSDAPPTPGKEQSTSVQGQTSGLEKGITNQSNQNKPKAEVKTLGDLVSYRTEGNSPNDTVIQKGGGAGTRSAIPSTRNKPGLRSDAPPTPEKEHAGSTGQQTGGVEIETTIQAGGGAGTRSAIPSTRNKPGLRSDAPPTPGKEQSTSVQGQTSGLEKGITNQSNQNKPKAEVKTLGDLVSYRTEGDSSKDTKQSKPSLIGLDQEGIRTSTSNSKQNNPKPKQETTTLGEISALAALRTSTNTSTEAYLVSQANQRDANFDESFKALISASNQKVRIPNYQVKSNDPAFYTTNLWSRLRQGNDTCFVASKLTAKELVQTGLIYVHVQFLSQSGIAVNEICIPVKVPAVAALQPASSILGLAFEVQKAVLNSDELKGQPITTKLYVSEFPKPYSLIMPYFTEEVGLFMLSTESGMVLSFTEVPIEESLQELVLNGFKQSLTIKK